MLDERLQCLTLRGINCSYVQISDHIGFSLRHLHTTCAAGHPIPQRRNGRRRRLTEK